MFGAFQRQFVGRGSFGNSRPCTDGRARADFNRCHQLDPRTDEGFIADNRPVFVGAIIVAGDGAGADVDAGPDCCVADIAQVVDLAAVRNRALFDLDEITDLYLVACSHACIFP